LAPSSADFHRYDQELLGAPMSYRIVIAKLI
jgi:hypothetical protein